MPTAGTMRWTRQDAIDYRNMLFELFGKGGFAEDTAFETRAGKTQAKLSQTADGVWRKNKKGHWETRDELVQRKIRKDIGRAGQINAQLNYLGKYIECMCPGAAFIPGPIKTFDSAWRKTRNDNKDRWTDSKDLARCTIAHERQCGVDQIVSTIYNICQLPYGMKLVKDKERLPTPSPDNPLGYSDWNFAVVFRGCALPAEIQVNTYDMMYGKMCKEEYTDVLCQGNRGEYARKELEMKFPGGLQHLLYEINRDARCTRADRDAAAELGIWYCEICRNQSKRGAEASECVRKYQALRASLESDFAKNVIDFHPLQAPWAPPSKRSRSNMVSGPPGAPIPPGAYLDGDSRFRVAGG
jgi:hypothetical protein